MTLTNKTDRIAAGVGVSWVVGSNLFRLIISWLHPMPLTLAQYRLVHIVGLLVLAIVAILCAMLIGIGLSKRLTFYIWIVLLWIDLSSTALTMFFGPFTKLT